MTARILALVATIGLCACTDAPMTSTASDGRRLGSAELAAMYPGGPYDGALPDGTAFTVTAAADRTASMRLASGRTDTGRWRIEQEHVCFAWTWVGEGKERCGHLYRQADGRYRSVGPDGVEILTFAPRR